ncbi:hypothetical protein ACFQ60_24835 [Streptomyces zhihengii]
MTSTSHSNLVEQPYSAQRTTLAFTDPSGRRRTTAVTFGPESRRDPLLPQRVRNGLLHDEEQRCVQVRLTTAEATHPAARALLDAEAGTALHLHRALDGTDHAQLFPAVVGHELDTAEPYLLYAAPRGLPASRTHVMSATDQRVLARDLMLALCLLDGQGMVPRGISPANVLWDGTSLQLWGLEAMARTGRPRTPGAGRPTARPSSAGRPGRSTRGTPCGAPPRCSTSS